jgi:hypothetical protein
LAVGDFNGDGLKDIAYNTRTSPGIGGETRFLLATGNLTYTNVSGGFASGAASPCFPCLPQSLAPLTVTWLRADDVDQDGIDDLVAVGRVGVTTNSATVGRIWIWPGRLGGVPGPVEWSDPPGLVGTSIQVEGPFLADLDLDGHKEIVVSPESMYFVGLNPVGVLPTTPDVLRLSPSNSAGARARHSLDMNAGRLDIVPLLHPVGPAGTANPHWLSGQITVGDVDNDGDLDLVEVWCNCFVLPIVLTSFPMVATHLNQTIRRKACAGTATTLGLVRSTPTINNPGYFIGLTGAPPGASAALLLSRGETSVTSGNCTVSVDITPGIGILPLGGYGFVTADASGSAFVPIPIPNDPSLLGFTAYAQWIATDPLGGFVIGGTAYSLSDVAQITIW